MLRLAQEGKSLRVINDQIGAPTGAELIADVTAHAVRGVQKDKGLSGTYHLAAAGETSWWNYVRLVIDEGSRAGLGLQTRADGVRPVRSEEFPTPASRPKNSRLDTSRLQKAFAIHLPKWEHGVRRCIHELCPG
jgi:dTDP-4-dehydrorhamnose reductase